MELLQEHNFKDPTAFPDKLLITVSGPDADLEGTKGSWQHITPEEILHSYLFAIARDAAIPDNHTRMKNWCFFLLTTSFSFILCTGEDIYWRQARIREDTAVAFQVVQRSALQKSVRDQHGLAAAARDEEGPLERAAGGALPEALAAGGIK